MNKNLTRKINQYLASLGVEYIKLHNLHWNVVGMNFKAVHEYLEGLYDGVTASLDAVAELLKMKDETPLASMKDYLEFSLVSELENRDYQIKETVEIVLKDFETFKALAEEIRKEADADDVYDVVGFFEGELEHFSKSIWFLKSMLK